MLGRAIAFILGGSVAVLKFALGCSKELQGRKSSIIAAPTAPSYRKTHWNKWGRRRPPFPIGFVVGGGRLDSKIDDFRPGSSIEEPEVDFASRGRGPELPKVGPKGAGIGPTGPGESLDFLRAYGRHCPRAGRPRWGPLRPPSVCPGESAKF